MSDFIAERSECLHQESKRAFMPPPPPPTPTPPTPPPPTSPPPPPPTPHPPTPLPMCIGCNRNHLCIWSRFCLSAQRETCLLLTRHKATETFLATFNDIFKLMTTTLWGDSFYCGSKDVFLFKLYFFFYF